MRRPGILCALVLLNLSGCGRPAAPAPAAAELARLQDAHAQDMERIRRQIAEQEKLLAAKDAAPAKETYTERTAALLDAAAKGQLSRVRELLDRGADVNDKNDQSETALLRAATNGHGSVVVLLLVRGASLTEKDREKQSALMKAAANGHDEIVKLLLAPNTLANLPGDLLKTAGVDLGKLAGGALNFDKLPLGLADKDAQDATGQTALMKAAANGHLRAVQALVEAPVDRALQDREGNTALMLAVRQGHLPIVKRLTSMENIAAPLLSKTDKQGRTALMLAAEGGHAEAMEGMLVACADDYRERVAARLALVTKQTAAGRTAADLAAAAGHKELAARLQAVADLDKRDEQGQTPLIRAVLKNDEAEVQRLLDQGAFCTMQDKEGRTALHYAVEKNQLEIARKLLAGYSYKVATHFPRDRAGQTVLMVAAREGHPVLVRLLLSYGGTVEPDRSEWIKSKDNEGKSARQLAEEKGHKLVVELLP